MQVGTIETQTEEVQQPSRRGSRRSSLGSGPSGGKGGNDGGGNNDDGNGPGRLRSYEPTSDEINRDKSRVIGWFVLLVVLMTFGGLIGAYIVIATNRAIEWAPFSLPVQVWISTVIIITSSVTYEFFRRAIIREDLDASRKYLIATAILGCFFIASQLIAWIELVNRGLYMRGNPYAGFFYILTAAHAVHVIGGMVAIGSVLRRTWYPAVNDAENRYRLNVSRAVGWYWHLMGGLWLVLFLLLGFWK